MKRRAARALALLVVLVVVAAAAAYNLSKPRLMILHSYGPDYAWTRDVDAGLRRVLAGDQHLALRWHYMDLKRHPWPQAKENAGVAARAAVEGWRPDVLIAVDDDAQEYVAKHYVNDPRIKIVFAGINGSIEPYGYDKADNVTGILERLPLAAVREALLQMNLPHRPLRLLEVSDTSKTVREDHAWIDAFDWRPVRYLGGKFARTFEEWQRIVTEAAGQADVLMTTNYRMLSRSEEDKRLVPPEEVVAWTERHSSLPVVGLNGFFVEDGGMLAIARSPFEQGETAARQALEIALRGRAPVSLPVETGSQFVVWMRSCAMDKHGLRLPELYEAFARATNAYYGEK